MSEDITVQSGGDEKRFVITRREALILLAVAAIMFAGYTVYDFNGHSFDLRDRQVLLIVTDSMDGDVTQYEVDSFPKDTFVMVHKLDQDEVVGEISKGDVVSFRSEDGKLIHHRAIETHYDVENKYIVTQGDNAPFTEKVHLEDVNGKVVGTNHWLGWLSAFAKEHVIAILIVLFVLVSADYARGVLKREKEIQKENEQDEFDN
jgi:hypothetical protein